MGKDGDGAGGSDAGDVQARGAIEGDVAQKGDRLRPTVWLLTWMFPTSVEKWKEQDTLDSGRICPLPPDGAGNPEETQTQAVKSSKLLHPHGGRGEGREQAVPAAQAGCWARGWVPGLGGRGWPLCCSAAWQQRAPHDAEIPRHILQKQIRPAGGMDLEAF